MLSSISVLIAQINLAVGAIKENTDKIINIIIENQEQYDLIIFPELAVTGYPLEDILLQENLYTQCDAAIDRITQITHDTHVIIGHPTIVDKRRYNSASVISTQKVITTYNKQHLPNYGVFDEKRYFKSGNEIPCIFTIKNQKIGICICEDLWQKGPVERLLKNGTSIIACLNASPFAENKYLKREKLVCDFAKLGATMIYVNLVGGQDELVFDGQSIVANNKGEIVARAQAFKEELHPVQISSNIVTSHITPLVPRLELIYKALICGLKDYVEKNRFPGVLLGLSGGIDSALTLAIAVDALGASRVEAVMMPSRYTSDMSVEDALIQIKKLGVKHHVLSIEPMFKEFLKTLTPSFKGLPVNATEENIQARIRGTLLMALSNKTGNMVVTTGNKSEMAVGYSTLYGDMAGGYSVLKDVLKTLVYKLAQYRNSISPIIPDRVITRPPSAELAPNQTDQDSLPDYSIIDGVLTDFMEHNMSATALIKKGYPERDVKLVLSHIFRNEYKRKQAAPGIKITSRVFGRDWRFPITSQFNHFD